VPWTQHISDTDRHVRAGTRRTGAEHDNARGMAPGLQQPQNARRLRPRADPWDATRGHVDACTRDQEAYGAAPATVALRLTAISSADTYAVQAGEVAANPSAQVRRPIPPSESPTPGLDRAQARAMLATAATGHTRDLVVVCLLMLNGLRVSEATGATRAAFATMRHTRYEAQLLMRFLSSSSRERVGELCLHHRCTYLSPRPSRRYLASLPVSVHNRRYGRFHALVRWPSRAWALGPAIPRRRT
jgi:integrase